MRYYTADPHFGHEYIIDLCDRPFASLEEMEEAVLEAWMQCLSRTDELYILGDLGGPSSSTEHVRSQVRACPASIQWVKGNHDRDAWAQDLDGVAGFRGDRVEIRTDRVDPRDDHPVFLVLDHYPMASWNRAFHGAVQLHGHVHGRFDDEGIRRLDVGIDSVDVEPVPEPEIIEQALAIDPPKYRT